MFIVLFHYECSRHERISLTPFKAGMNAQKLPIENDRNSLDVMRDNADSREKPRDLKIDLNAVVKKTARLLEEKYVFPEAGKKCGQVLEKRLNAGAYRDIRDLKALAEALTKDILNETKDKHNRLRVIESSDMGEKTDSPFHQPLRLYRLMQSEHYGFFGLQWFKGNIGYLDFRRFSALSCGKEMMDSAMRFLRDTYAVIIDLRENQGGSGDMIQYLSSYFFSHPTELVGLYSRTENLTIESWTFEKTGGRHMTDVPLFILTGPNAFSAAETFAFDMKTRKRAVLVGEPTAGGAHDVELFNINEHLEIYISTGRAVSPVTGGNWEGKGVLPDVAVPAGAALDTALVLAGKAAESYGEIKEQALKMDADSLQADLVRAEELFRMEKDEEAEKVLDHFFRTGERLDFINTFLINVLAMGYFSPMNDKMLITILKKNIGYHPDSSEAYEILAYAYDKLGKMDLAEQFYQRALEMNPLNGYAKARLKQM